MIVAEGVAVVIAAVAGTLIAEAMVHVVATVCR